MTSDLATLIRECAAMGAVQAVAMLHPEGDRISQRRAEAMFGRAFLRRHRGELNMTVNGNRLEYSRAECEQLRRSEGVAGIVARIEDNFFQQSLKNRKNGNL